MNLSLPSELKRFVEKKIKDGLYQNEGDVVCDALRGMRAKDRFQSDLTGLLQTSIRPSETGMTMDLAGADIEAMIFFILMQAAKDANEDLRSIMAEMKAIIAAKQKLRALISKINKDVSHNVGQKDRTPPLNFSKGMGSQKAYHKVQMPVPDPESVGGVRLIPTDLYEGEILEVEDLKTIQEELKGKLDSMSEMSEMTSLRLQMIMDRRSKFISTLSNIMKKISSTQDILVQNLK